MLGFSWLGPKTQFCKGRATSSSYCNTASCGHDFFYSLIRGKVKGECIYLDLLKVKSQGQEF